MSAQPPFNAAEACFRAVLPAPVKILGLELRPFCAGHIVILHSIRNAFVLADRVPITEAELATALAICSFTFEEGQAFLRLSQEEIDQKMRAWRRELTRAKQPFAIAENAARFVDYVAAGSEFPMHFVPTAARNTIPITDLPKLQLVRCALRHYFHLTDSEFWNMPWGLALWDYYTALVLQGHGDMVNPSSLSDAQRVADDLFRKLNPTLFDASGNMTEAAREDLIEKGLLCRN